MRLLPRLEGKQKYCVIIAQLIQFPFLNTAKQGNVRVPTFAKAHFGHPSPSSRQKLNGTNYNLRCPDSSCVHHDFVQPSCAGCTHHDYLNDSTATKAVTKSSSPFASAHTTSIHPQRCLSRTKNHHFAGATFPRFSALASGTSTNSILLRSIGLFDSCILASRSRRPGQCTILVWQSTNHHARQYSGRRMATPVYTGRTASIMILGTCTTYSIPIPE